MISGARGFARGTGLEGWHVRSGREGAGSDAFRTKGAVPAIAGGSARRGARRKRAGRLRLPVGQKGDRRGQRPSRCHLRQGRGPDQQGGLRRRRQGIRRSRHQSSLFAGSPPGHRHGGLCLLQGGQIRRCGLRRRPLPHPAPRHSGIGPRPEHHRHVLLRPGARSQARPDIRPQVAFGLRDSASALSRLALCGRGCQPAAASCATCSPRAR